MRVLLTGATGFIGSHILDSLLRQGIAVTALVVPETLGDLQHRAEIKVVLGSLFDDAVLAQATVGADLIIHSAAKILGSTRADLWAVNVRGTSNLLRAAVANRTQKFVYLSSTAVYRPPQFAFQLPITENSPLGPFGNPTVTDYGESKIQAERLIMAFHDRYGLGYTIVRPTIAYGLGPGPSAAFIEGFLQDVRLWSSFLTWAGSTAGVSMQWVHVKDLAATVVDASMRPAGMNQIFNTAGSEAFTIQTLAEVIREIQQPRPANWMRLSPALTYDISKAQRLLDYRPKIYLRNGIAEILSNMQRRGYLIPSRRLAGYGNVDSQRWLQAAPDLRTYHA